MQLKDRFYAGGSADYHLWQSHDLLLSGAFVLFHFPINFILYTEAKI